MIQNLEKETTNSTIDLFLISRFFNFSNLIDDAPFITGYCSEGADRDRSMSGDSAGLRFRGSRRGYASHQSSEQETLSWIPEQAGPVIIHGVHHHDSGGTAVEEKQQQSPSKVDGSGGGSLQSKSQHQIHVQPQDDSYLAIPKPMAGSSSSDTLTGRVACFCLVFAGMVSTQKK